MSIDVATAIMLLGGIVGLSVVNELVKIFFQRLRTSDYMSEKKCRAQQALCQQGRETEEDTLTGEISNVKTEIECVKNKVNAIAKLLMKMAVKNGIDPKDIEGIM